MPESVGLVSVRCYSAGIARCLASGEAVVRAGAALASDRLSVMNHSASALLGGCRRPGLEGIVCNQKDSVYRSGSHSGWNEVRTE